MALSFTSSRTGIDRPQLSISSYFRTSRTKYLFFLSKSQTTPRRQHTMFIKSAEDFRCCHRLLRLRALFGGDKEPELARCSKNCVYHVRFPLFFAPLRSRSSLHRTFHVPSSLELYISMPCLSLLYSFARGRVKPVLHLFSMFVVLLAGVARAGRSSSERGTDTFKPLPSSLENI